MKNKNFTIVCMVDQNPEQVYKAITNVRGWWGKGIAGESDKLGAEFTYQHGDIHRTTQKITKLIPGAKVVWHVTKSYISFAKDHAEWADTDIIFNITTKGEKTELKFTHRGLQPKIECYEQCSKGWNYYITESLKRFIETGKGRPDPKEKGTPQNASRKSRLTHS